VELVDQGTTGVGIESNDPWRTARAKALSYVTTDAVRRKCGERRGLDTLVVHTLNDGGYRLGPFLLLRHNSLVSESWSAALAAQGPGVWSHPRSEGIKLPAWGV